MKRQNIKQYILGLFFVAACCPQQIQALPFEPVAMETLPQAFTVRNFFSWAQKALGLAQSLQGAQYIDSSDLALQEQGVSFLESAHSAFAKSRSWANYRSWFPPINWVLEADLRNPWHKLALVTSAALATALVSYGAYRLYKKIKGPQSPASQNQDPRPVQPVPAPQVIAGSGLAQPISEPGAPVNP